ncbi:MAG: transaldolase [Actinomycetes bacterium]
MTKSALQALSDTGVSIWLDDLDRHRIESGNLASLIATKHVVGVTTNPSIFEKALTSGVAEYDEQLQELRARGASAQEAVRALTVRDVTAACDIFDSTWRATSGIDGRVSLEVDPRLAHDTPGTTDQAIELWNLVDRANLMIKIPATPAGLPSIAHVLAHGISVNVTLIFSVERYIQVMESWLTGLEQAAHNGHDLSTIESVASFFVSRVDTLVDAQLDAIGTMQATELRGKAAIANAQLAWTAFEDVKASPRWKVLAAQGAHIQRPLWASTGVKDPAYDDTRYVVELAAPICVNTMPEGTLNAVADHGISRGDTVSGTQASAVAVWQQLESVGINRAGVFHTLETEGVEKFIAAWNQLLGAMADIMKAKA